MQIIGGSRYYWCVVVVIMILTLLTTATTVSGGGGKRRGWRQLKPAASQLECGRELHDLQSKWLQAPLVVVGQWSAGDERQTHDGGDVRTRRFNVSITVRTVLKKSSTKAATSSRRVSEPSDGSRILVGEFSGVLARRQHSQQKRLCTPSRLANRRKGYIFFLEPTHEPGYYRHIFLPAKLNRRNLKKLNRVSCKRPNNCPQAPLLMKAIPKGVRSHGVSSQASAAAASRREISVGFVCRARGLPTPTVRWLKDGVQLVSGSRVKAQFKKRSKSMTSRLNIRSMGPSDAGNYTCLFSNIVGSVNATFKIGTNHSSIAWSRLLSQLLDLYAAFAAPSGGSSSSSNNSSSSQSESERFRIAWHKVDEILNAGRKALSPDSSSSSSGGGGGNMPNAYLCDTSNLTYCMNGGTCIINSLDGRPQCKCPSDYSGFICEKPNIYLGVGIVA